MDDRSAGAVAGLVGLALALVGALEYLLPGLAQPPYDPLATGVLVVGTGFLLFGTGLLAISAALDHLALRAATAVGLGVLLLAVVSPDALLFGGVFWLALVAAGLVAAGAYRTAAGARAVD